MVGETWRVPLSEQIANKKKKKLTSKKKNYWVNLNKKRTVILWLLFDFLVHKIIYKYTNY